MRKLSKPFLIACLFFIAENSTGQTLLTGWLRNTTGKTASYYATGSGMPPTYTWTTTTDSADVLTVAYNTNYVYIRSNGLTDSMGKYLNPGTCISQGYKHIFPRTPTVPSTKTISPKVGQIGLLINGIPIYGLSNSNSYNGSTNTNNGSGVWNVEVGISEGFVLDLNYGAHPQQQGAYHTHDKPYRLYRYYSTAQHSPLIGFAFDGYPVYGPYGYATATNAGSGITRMKTGYSLRNITTRTTLPYGVAASQTGPPVNTTYPLGTYCEDYEWLAANGGDLDKYNGRFCVTPEYPAGTYAYFVTIDAAGAAAFPYYIGIEYYGAPLTANFPAGPSGNTVTIPAGVTIYNGTVLPVRLERFTGKTKGPENELQWSLADITNVSAIQLERSADAMNFSSLVKFTGGALSTSSYTDHFPVAKNYYRLKMTDANSSVNYSSVLNLNNKPAFNVYPTVTAGLITVSGLAVNAASQYIVRDALGRTVLNRKFAAGQQTISLDISALKKGSYLLTIQNDDQMQTEKIIRE